jgi:hypothetical protein
MKVPVSIRMEEKLLKWIDEQAELENRNRTNYIEWALMLHRVRALSMQDNTFKDDSYFF